MDRIKVERAIIGLTVWQKHVQTNSDIDRDISTAIEALKAQLSKEGTTSDLISKTETVERLRGVLDVTVPITDYDGGYVDGVEVGISTISTMPTIQPEPQWIPVSERLPETTDPVLTTYIVNGDRSRKYVEESAYYENDEYWCSPWDEYRKEGTRIEVIAWMPEPEPYKPNK